MIRFFYVLTTIGGIIGIMILVFVLTSATGAPQEAAGAAIAIACAAIPYCIARSLHEMRRAHIEGKVVALGVTKSTCQKPPPSESYGVHQFSSYTAGLANFHGVTVENGKGDSAAQPSTIVIATNSRILYGKPTTFDTNFTS